MEKVGRPTRDPKGKASKLFPVRLTDSERAEFERAAKRAELSVSEWMRDRLAKAARREAKRV
jgi:predicted HicB family RNase H-like nuclease